MSGASQQVQGGALRELSGSKAVCMGRDQVLERLRVLW